MLLYFHFPADLFKVPSVSIFAWMLLSMYFFYGTGQQPAFPTLQWEAAFVGMNEGYFSTQNIYVRGLLVILNTFSSQIIVSFMLPLILIAPFTLYAIFPSLGGEFEYYYSTIYIRKIIFNF